MKSLRGRLGASAPDVDAAISFYRQLRRQRAELKRAARDERSPGELVTTVGEAVAVDGYRLFDTRVVANPMVAVQKRDELVGLLERIRELRPVRLLDIGAATGTTLFLFTRVADPGALLISLDTSLPRHTAAARARMKKPGQRVVSLQGDSHSVKIQARVERLLDRRPLDFLFIDGDHTFEGVRRDFEFYGPLVRPGGLIAFHDIHPDRGEGGSGAAWSGGVPDFWEEVKPGHRTEELIADPGQAGFGIGLLWVEGTATSGRRTPP